MTVGAAPTQADLLRGTAAFCDGRVGESSIWAVLHRECHRLFPDDMFADLFADIGRRSVPPMIVAVVMVLQRLFGLSDREAVEAFCFDARWKYACGGLAFDYPGFAHTVLVDMRARLRSSSDERRIFTVTVQAAREAGLVGARRVLDSTPLYDAVATMDTVTLIRSAMRGLLAAVDTDLAGELRAQFTSGDDYASAAKPGIDWDDPAAREALIDSLALDALGCLMLLEGRPLPAEVARAAELLATVVGQDLEMGDDKVFRIARRVARDRVISTVDPDARHGHKTSARGFDGYKAAAAIDPDSEIITDTAVSAANTGDASVAAELIDDLLDEPTCPPPAEANPGSGHDLIDAPDDHDRAGAATSSARHAGGGGRRSRSAKQTKAAAAQARAARRAERTAKRAARRKAADTTAQRAVYGDAAYGTGEFLDRLAQAGIASYCKTQPPVAPAGRFTKDRFRVDLAADTVTCPAGTTVAVRRDHHGDGVACFADACATCPLRDQCTDAEGGRTISVSRHESRLADARAQAADPAWAAEYRATRPKVERKLAHLMRRRHGGRRARVRGKTKVDADFNLLAAAHNLARLAILGLRSNGNGTWAVT